jgi:RimJ/RimL family protein N-acetyltransferase
MENMPYQAGFEVERTIRHQPKVHEVRAAATMEVPARVPTRREDTTSWRSSLPVLCGAGVTLRPLRKADAASLFSLLTADEVTRFISPPPPNVEGFERFIEWTHSQCAAGTYACMAIVPAGYDVAVGFVQVRQLEPSFATAEWGIVLGSAFWGSGVFTETARLFLDFVFDTVGVHRLEARAAVRNGRANGAIRKLGGVQEGVLRSSLCCRGQYHDQLLWSILADDWRQSRAVLRPIVH